MGENLLYVSVNDEKIYVENNTLDLSNKNIKDIAEIQGLESLENLVMFDLSHNELTTVDYSILKNLKFLSTLNLSHNKLSTTRGIQKLRKLVVFLELDLSGNEIQSIPGLKTLTHLHKLHIYTNPIYEKIKNEPFFLQRFVDESSEDSENFDASQFSAPQNKPEYYSEPKFQGSLIAATINFFTFAAVGFIGGGYTISGFSWLVGLVGGLFLGAIGAVIGYFTGRCIICIRF